MLLMAGAATMTLVNPIGRAWSQDRAAFGVLSRLGAPLSVEFAARAGVDYVCLDMQHGLGGLHSLAEEIAACWAGGAAPLVRTAGEEPWLIAKPLDLGAAGVIVPQISNVEQAALAVAACHHPPAGTRSYGPLRSGADADEGEATDARAMCFAMIETLEGLESVERIAAVAGLNGLYVGVIDLALAMGLAPRGYGASEQHAAALQRIRAACDAAGIVAGMHCHNGREAHDAAANGFRLITIGSDLTLLRGSVARELGHAASGSV